MTDKISDYETVEVEVVRMPCGCLTDSMPKSGTVIECATHDRRWRINYRKNTCNMREEK